MRKFIVKITLFFLIMFVIDIIIGNTFKYLQSHSKGGSTQRMEYIANFMTDSILIMGSSRAIHHYDPRIFVDSLYLSTFNCGMDGNGIIYNYGLYCLFKRRYSPKLIIYDIFHKFDLLTYPSNERYINGLRHYYDRVGLDSIFYYVDETEKYKMLSQMRRYNGDFIYIISNYLNSDKSDILGYRPLRGIMDYDPIKEDPDNKISYDSLKLAFFERLIKETKNNNTKLVLCISPIYEGESDSIYKPLFDLALEKDVPLLNHYNDSSFIYKKSYFKDSGHLNCIGAEEYTKKIVQELNQYIKY